MKSTREYTQIFLAFIFVLQKKLRVVLEKLEYENKSAREHTRIFFE